MNTWDSDSLIKMLYKASNTPSGRILALFDILEKLQNAPNFSFSEFNDLNANNKLFMFLTTQSADCGAIHPEIVARQILSIISSAMQEQLISANSTSIVNAKVVTNVLLSVYTQRKNKFEVLIKSAGYAAFASAIFAISISFFWLRNNDISEIYKQKYSFIAGSNNGKNNLAERYSYAQALRPSDSANYFQKYDQTLAGVCEYQEVLSIPAKHRVIYLQSVVNRQLPESSQDLAITNYYLSKLNCFYSPFIDTKHRIS